jgi:hypothetical protein
MITETLGDRLLLLVRGFPRDSAIATKKLELAGFGLFEEFRIVGWTSLGGVIAATGTFSVHSPIILQKCDKMFRRFFSESGVLTVAD